MKEQHLNHDNEFILSNEAIPSLRPDRTEEPNRRSPTSEESDRHQVLMRRRLLEEFCRPPRPHRSFVNDISQKLPLYPEWTAGGRLLHNPMSDEDNRHLVMHLLGTALKLIDESTMDESAPTLNTILVVTNHEVEDDEEDAGVQDQVAVLLSKNQK
jgi:hypothetical protein